MDKVLVIWICESSLVGEGPRGWPRRVILITWAGTLSLPRAQASFPAWGLSLSEGSVASGLCPGHQRCLTRRAAVPGLERLEPQFVSGEILSPREDGLLGPRDR